jgi:hypothetical protein
MQHPIDPPQFGNFPGYSSRQSTVCHLKFMFARNAYTVHNYPLLAPNDLHKSNKSMHPMRRHRLRLSHNLCHCSNTRVQETAQGKGKYF